jgi:predicted ABC-type ATPase
MPTAPPSIVALAGPNGAGKSTVGSTLLRETLGITTFVNADVIAQGLSGFDPEGAAFEAGRILLERFDDLARRRTSFAFETTLSGRAYLRRILQLVERGYRFHVVFVWLRSPELAVARVRERVRSGGHSIPEHVVRRRYRSGLRNLFQLYLPATTSWRIYDNSGGTPPLLVASGRGSVARRVADPAKWTQVAGDPS